MNNDLISREALKEHKFLTPEYLTVIGGRHNGKMREQIIRAYQKGWNDCIDAIIDNAPTAVDVKGAELAYNNGYKHAKEKYKRPQDECEKCDYHNFTQAIINGIVELMSKNGITTIEELLETLKGGAE